MPRSEDAHKIQLDRTSTIESFLSQPSHQPSQNYDSSLIDGDCNSCKKFKKELESLKQTVSTMIRDAAIEKRRQDNNLASSLKAQENMHEELTKLRSSNVTLHIELTNVKTVLRDIQCALGRSKF